MLEPDTRTAPEVSACRACGAPLHQEFANLGVQPVSNAFRSRDQLGEMEPHFPLRVMACRHCRLVQLLHPLSPYTHFGADYAYFSSYSSTWLEHCERYANTMISRFGLGLDSKVIEVASNDGGLLQFFAKQGIPVLGVDPARNVADAARTQRGVETVVDFFGRKLADVLHRQGHAADLMIANNVLAHVPDIDGFLAGFAVLTKKAGIVTFEFPHVLEMIKKGQFDTIYHEHYYYLSFFTVETLLRKHGLMVFDVETLNTHGGSLRVFVCHSEEPQTVQASVISIREREAVAGIDEDFLYADFGRTIARSKRSLLSFLIEQKRLGRKVVGYGAPAKGNTLLNYCGVGLDFLDFTVDLNRSKQGLFLPGNGIPILAPDAISKAKPDFMLILAWNLREEIAHQMSHIRGWGGKFVVPIPELEIF